MPLRLVWREAPDAPFLFASSADGAAWETASQDGQYKNYVRGLAFGLGRFVALGGDPGCLGAGCDDRWIPFGVVGRGTGFTSACRVGRGLRVGHGVLLIPFV